MQVWKREVEVRDTVSNQMQMKCWPRKISENLQEHLRSCTHLQSHSQEYNGGFGAMVGG